jgi:limonene-1,2-epoxide hydrolase
VSVEANRRTVERFWETLYARDWDGIAAFFTDDATYTDIGTPADDVATGPDEIVRRLRLGLEPIEGYEHRHLLTVAEGDAVVTEHTETWRWRTGESVTLPFVSVQQLRDGRIARWCDYWDLQTLLGAAPAWWIEHITGGWR